MSASPRSPRSVQIVWEREVTLDVPEERLAATLEEIKSTGRAPHNAVHHVEGVDVASSSIFTESAAAEPSQPQQASVFIQEPQEEKYRFDFATTSPPQEVSTPTSRQENLTTPLLGANNTVPRRGGYDEEIASPRSSAYEFTSNFWTSVSLLSSGFVSVGLLATPKLFALLGIIGGILAVLLVALLFYLSFGILTRALTDSRSYTNTTITYKTVVKDVLGCTSSVVLDVTSGLFTFGAMVLILLVLRDVLVGEEALLKDWEDQQGVVLGVLTVIVLAPLSSFKQLRYFSAASFLGLSVVGLWALITVALIISAVAHGEIHHMRLLPDFNSLGKSLFSKTVQLLASITVLLVNAATHSSLYQVLQDARPSTAENRRSVSTTALMWGFIPLYLVIGLGSYSLFGSSVSSDVLESFTVKSLQPLIGSTLASACFLAVRLAFIVSLVSGFPLLMSSFRASVWRLLFWQELSGGVGVVLVTYGLTAAVFAVAMGLEDIWRPLVLIGSLGSVLALIFPGLVALRRQGDEGILVGGVLIVTGVLFALVGFVSLLFLS